MSSVEQRTAGERTSGSGRKRRSQMRWRVWRSPPDQPGWARPALLSIAGLAGLAYAWGADSASLEPFYAAAARSMSSSWHDFLFGAFDPAGTVTVDKLPGALWPQALALRVLGFHVWVVVLPQMLEGVAAILVLYRAVRRLAGPVAGIVAALVLAASPATVALNRGNVSDSLLILLTVLAADSTSAALRNGRLRTLLLAGVWVGLAFQTKMIQAWLVLPALAIAYLVAAPPRWRVRLGHVALAGAVTIAVSLSWMSAVSLVPAHERPYVDGSLNDSLFSQVFDYNGIARLKHGSALPSAGTPARFLVDLYRTGGTFESIAVKPSWHRLLGGLFGREDGWLLPAASIAAAGVLLERRRASRRDPLRACVLLWGTWLAVLAVAFSEGVYLNAYYVAALSPATAALCGTGVAVLWPRRGSRRTRAALAGALLASVGYGAYLLRGGSAVPGWLLPAGLCVGIGGALAVLLLRDAHTATRATSATAGLAVAGALALPAAASALVVARGLGPFEAPFQPRVAAQPAGVAGANTRRAVEQFSSEYGTPIVFATDTSTLASTYIYYTGREVLPIGGYLGGVPSPSLAQLQRYIAQGRLRAFLVPIEPPGSDPRIAWVRAHCKQTLKVRQTARVAFGIYDCSPQGGA